MKVELFPFQKKALTNLRMFAAEALGAYRRTHSPQVISFTAPTGAGKTIIMASLIESILFGDEQYADQKDAIIVWLSDSPQLNEQSKQKIEAKADKIPLGRCVTISDESFDQEVLDDGHVYFLNTQKLGKSSNLTKHSDSRQYTIWQTLANTAREKSDRLYVIIDEAHRGMQGSEAGKATTIMQKFLKGSTTDRLSPMPVVIGMSATSERFNALVKGTTSTIHQAIVTADDVRASGLLKDRIVITYPNESSLNKDMAVLQAAADDWKQKWDHWYQYCYEQHYAHVYPIFVVQVLSGTGKRLSDTDLDDCLKKIEDRTGFRFKSGEVVHTFGQTSSSIQINGLDVRYEEPSRIAEDRNIKVVFFKENLSTGWDCPRAETMMSFRRAVDSTYIAQLLGRMVRTPLQMHVDVDDVLNDVHLYLPHFDADTVHKVIDELQSAEGGDIPTEVTGEELNKPVYETLTLYPTKKIVDTPKAQTKPHVQVKPVVTIAPTLNVIPDKVPGKQQVDNVEKSLIDVALSGEPGETNTPVETPSHPDENVQPELPQPDSELDAFDRGAVVKFINDSGLLTYDVRSVQITNYLVSTFKLARLLSQTGLYPDAIKDFRAEVVSLIHQHIEELQKVGRYAELAKKVQEFKLSTQVFDVFGESVENYQSRDSLTTTDTDIDRQFRLAETKLGNEGIGNEYGRYFFDPDNPNEFKIDVIIFAADKECINNLHTFAKQAFHAFNDNYRRQIAKLSSDRVRKQYDNIVSDGDVVSKHNFRLPETIKQTHDTQGVPYENHLFVNPETGVAVMDLNGWEVGVIAEEEQQADFVCWLRNPPRKPWSLCMPYEFNGETKAMYPDFIVIRQDGDGEYVIDILEPHNPALRDNLGKAKGLAEYARQNPGCGRIQLIRMDDSSIGQKRFKRLDMSKSQVRDKVLKAMSNEEIDYLFVTDGVSFLSK